MSIFDIVKKHYKEKCEERPDQNAVKEYSEGNEEDNPFIRELQKLTNKDIGDNIERKEKIGKKETVEPEDPIREIGFKKAETDRDEIVR